MYTAAEFAAYVAKDEDLSLGCTVTREDLGHDAHARPYYSADFAVPEVFACQYYWEAEILVSIMKQHSGRVASAEAMVVLAQVAHRLRQYKKAHGQYPEGFDMPPDPFDGQPIRYERQGEGFMIWSAAKDEQGQRIEWRWDK